MTFVLILLGFGLLVKGADWFVDGAAALAHRFRIPEIVIGLTLVAFGTSAPELAVNIFASLRGSGGIVLGNILGSNIANIALILGVTGILSPLVIHANLIKKEIPLSILAASLLFLLARPTGEFFTINRFGGLILLVGFVVFLVLIYQTIRHHRKTELAVLDVELDTSTPKKVWIALGLTLGGLLALVIGGKIVIDNAVIIAKEIFGVSETLIGLTIVALGTSAPELVTSIAAARKGKADLAIGNVVGSNLFNIFWVLGASALIRPVVFEAHLFVDIAVLIGISIPLLLIPFIRQGRKIAFEEGVLLIVAYCAYLGFTIYRG